LALTGFKTAALDADFNHTLTDWVTTAAKQPITVRHELNETKIVPLVAELHDTHDVVVIDTAGAASQATIFAIGCADIVLVPIQTSSADIVDAAKSAIKRKPIGKRDSLPRSPRKDGSIHGRNAGVGRGQGARLPPLGHKLTHKPRLVRPRVVNLAPFSLSDESL